MVVAARRNPRAGHDVWTEYLRIKESICVLSLVPFPHYRPTGAVKLQRAAFNRHKLRTRGDIKIGKSNWPESPPNQAEGPGSYSHFGPARLWTWDPHLASVKQPYKCQFRNLPYMNRKHSVTQPFQKAQSASAAELSRLEPYARPGTASYYIIFSPDFLWRVSSFSTAGGLCFFCTSQYLAVPGVGTRVCTTPDPGQLGPEILTEYGRIPSVESYF